MADEITPSAPAIAAASAAPAAATNDAASSSATPAAPSTLASDATPASAPAKIEAAPVTPESDITVLGADKIGEAPKDGEKTPEVKPEVKADDKQKPEDKKTEGEKPADQKTDAPEGDKPESLPTYEDFKTPEGLALDKEQVGQFNGMLGEFERTTKASHEEVQKFGQSLIDKHVAEVQQVSTKIQESYQNAWTKQKAAWFGEFKADPEIGGPNLEATSTAVRNAIETYGGTAAQKADFRKLMKNTGIGNAPALIRTINNFSNEISRLKAKYETEDEVKQLAATKPNSAPKSKIEKRYGASS